MSTTSKRKRRLPSRASNGYLISFGDTMTAMLAFFIVLNTLAKDQTGANLHAGTGSFVLALNSLGVPGVFPGEASRLVHPMEGTTPKYKVDTEAGEDDQGHGPDETDNRLRVLDRDLDSVQRLLTELDELFDVSEREMESRAVVFDLFDPLGPEGKPLLPPPAVKVLGQALPLLSRPGTRLEVRLWSPTPAPSAIARTLDQSRQVAREIRKTFPHHQEALATMRVSASTWGLSDQQRPVLSITVARDTVPAE
jgi:hypothetical protein